MQSGKSPERAAIVIYRSNEKEGRERSCPTASLFDEGREDLSRLPMAEIYGSDDGRTFGGRNSRPRQRAKADCKTRVMRPNAPALFDSLDGGAAPVPTTRTSGNGGKMVPPFNERPYKFQKIGGNQFRASGRSLSTGNRVCNKGRGGKNLPCKGPAALATCTDSGNITS